MEKKMEPSLMHNQESNEKHEKEKIACEKSEKDTVVKKDDPCKKDKVKGMEEFYLPADDPRFQQQNQTARCYVMYTDFYRCEHILGEGSEACKWFKEVFTIVCPNAWVEHWDELRVTGRLPWHKHKTQGAFPGCKYGE